MTQTVAGHGSNRAFQMLIGWLLQMPAKACVWGWHPGLSL
jgi:hypothetical protein